MHITMVKKILSSGETCSKCSQAEERLRERGLWSRINRVVVADERDRNSVGWQLARDSEAELAPFWIIRFDDGSTELVTSLLKLTRLLDGLEDTISQTSVDLAPKNRRQVREIERLLASSTPQETLKWANATFGKSCHLAFSGAEDVVLLDMAAKLGATFTVFTLDTGRLHPETHDYIERVRIRYGIEIHILTPDPKELGPFVREKGLFSFLKDGHAECCGIRKLSPLRQYLEDARAWVSGQRRDQSPTRTDVPHIQVDDGFSGSGPDGLLVKLNPLAKWSSKQVWEYIRSEGLPYNALHDRGFRSIGCAPCTRATNPGEHEREGRWWWEEATQRECGLHLGKPTP